MHLPSIVSRLGSALLIAACSLFAANAAKVADRHFPPAKANHPGSAEHASARSKTALHTSMQNPCDIVTPINFEQDVTGALATTDCRLNDGSYADIYSFTGAAGQQIAIT